MRDCCQSRRNKSKSLLRARGVLGLFRANSVGDDIELYADDERTEQLAVIHTLRQQMPKPPGRPNLALADFVAPRESGVPDYVGAFAVTAGEGLDALVAGFEASHDDYGAIMAKALADRLAEAFAERLHEQVRRDHWGYARHEALDNAAIIREQYQGIRPAPGDPRPSTSGWARSSATRSKTTPAGRGSRSRRSSAGWLPT